ncbi:unnamed protein product, partial [Mesorhabditis belari]|uniref:Serpentine Receptor, class T n=1 Tax=Mesorhabditis belari TaxID=2138241 RepID=A0AAF3EVR8_9BILA
MQRWLQHGSDVNNLGPLYDCSRFNLTKSQWLSVGNREPILGWGSLIYGILIEIIYVPCLFAITKPEFIKHSCYKIMLFIGLNDMVAITVNSIITGYGLIIGTVYCVDPNFQYISGAVGLATWCSACLACLILVFNRVCALWRPSVVEDLFGGHKAYIVMLIPFFYCFWFIFFTPPIMFNSPMKGWFLYPFFENAQKFFTVDQWKNLHVIQDMTPYANFGMIANNLFVVFASVIMYLVFCLILMIKFYSKTSKKMTFAQKSIFYQSAMISAANLYTALIYTYMQFYPQMVAPWMIFIGHAGCMFSHGILL